MEQFVVTWKDPDGTPKQSMPRDYTHAFRLAANFLAATVPEVVGGVGEVLKRVTTRKSKTLVVVSDVKVIPWT